MKTQRSGGRAVNGGSVCGTVAARSWMMAPSFYHENYSRLICRLIQIMTVELRIPLVSGGSTTFRREDLQRGLQPDECYYISHAADVRGQAEIDLRAVPPPDLAVEVDVTCSSLNRQGIYASLGVPEIWRFDTCRLQVYLLKRRGAYRISKTSRAFPFLPMDDFAEFLVSGVSIDETQQAIRFAEWVRSDVAPRLA